MIQCLSSPVLGSAQIDGVNTWKGQHNAERQQQQLQQQQLQQQQQEQKETRPPSEQLSISFWRRTGGMRHLLYSGISQFCLLGFGVYIHLVVSVSLPAGFPLRRDAAQLPVDAASRWEKQEAAKKNDEREMGGSPPPAAAAAAVVVVVVSAAAPAAAVSAALLLFLLLPADGGGAALLCGAGQGGHGPPVPL